MKTYAQILFRRMGGWLKIIESAYGSGVAEKIERETDEEMTVLSEIEKDYRLVELPKVKDKIRQFKLEMDGDESLRQSRSEYLKELEGFLESESATIENMIQKSFEQKKPHTERMILNITAKEIGEKLKRAKFTSRMSDGNVKDAITPEMILRAREYPIENLIEVNSRGMAVCPYHDDHSPSMLVKNGFAYCFVCRVSKDAIDLAMDKFNLKFPQAIKKLNNIIK